MIDDLKSLAATGARCTFYVVSRAILFTVVGVLLNLVLLAVLWPELSHLAREIPGIPAARAGGLGAVLALLALVTASFPLLALVLVFGLVLPAAYLILGKKHGISKALALVTARHAEPMADYLRDRVVAYAETPQGAELGARLAAGRTQLPGLLARLDDLPAPVRFLVRHLGARLKIGTILAAVAEEQRSRGESTFDPRRDASVIRERLLRTIRERYGAAGLAWFWILLGVNFAAFIAAKILI